VDIVVRREPDEVVRVLANSLEHNKGLDTVKGVTYKEGGKVYVNVDMPFIEDLDRLPFPDRKIVNNELYRMPFTSEPFTLINTSRGCPFSCIYCTAHLYYGKKFRTRDPFKVVDEIDDCVNKYGIMNFLFWADEATFDKAKMEKICSEIKRRNLNIRWFCNSRADLISQELLKKMKDAGCFLISFGLESGDQRILDNVKKGLKVEDLRRAVKDAKKAGLQVIGHFIFGLPGETWESAHKTIDFAKKSGVDYAQFYIAIPYPGTEMYDLLKKRNYIITDDYSQYEIMNAVVRTEKLTAKDLMDIKKKAFGSFYLRPTYILSRLLKVRSIRELRGLITQGVHFLKDWAFGEVR
jgi:radical SAM superfamily enzyme YgiQ (UPF0313 family)